MKTKFIPIILGISGPTLSTGELEFFKSRKVFGFILFAANIQNKDQLAGLITSLKGLYKDWIPQIFVDQEGGRVQRVKPPIAEKLYPTAEYFGNMYDQEGKIKALAATKENYASLMKELKELGFDSTCAPVADLRIRGAHDVIGDRSFGSNVNKVVDLCNAAIEGIVQEKGMPVIKHIPGHGRAFADSHLSLPTVDTSLDELNSSDFAIFRLLAKNPKVKYAMTAHILFSAIDQDLPVTCSKKGIDFIRSEIGFKGLILTDAIEMLALHGVIGAKYGIVKRALNILTKQQQQTKLSPEILDTLAKYNIIDEAFAKQTHEEQIRLLNIQKEAINPEFIQSLIHASRTALDAGCDLILHCTGEFDQLSALCDALPQIDERQLTGEPLESKE